MQQHDTAPELPDEVSVPASNTSGKTTTPQQAQIPTLGQRRARVKFKDPSAAYDLRGRGGIAGDMIHVSTNTFQQRRQGNVLDSFPCMHETLPSGKDTSMQTRPSGLCRGQSTEQSPP